MKRQPVQSEEMSTSIGIDYHKAYSVCSGGSVLTVKEMDRVTDRCSLYKSTEATGRSRPPDV